MFTIITDVFVIIIRKCSESLHNSIKPSKIQMVQKVIERCNVGCYPAHTACELALLSKQQLKRKIVRKKRYNVKNSTVKVLEENITGYFTNLEMVKAILSMV